MTPKRQGEVFCSNVQYAHWTEAIQKWIKDIFGSSNASPTDKNGDIRSIGCATKSIVYVIVTEIFHKFGRILSISSIWQRIPFISGNRNLSLRNDLILRTTTQLLLMKKIYLRKQDRLVQPKFFDIHDWCRSKEPITAPGRPKLIHIKKKTWAFLPYIVQKSMNDGELNNDPCKATGPPAKIYHKDTKHRIFIGCDSDSKCIK